MNADHPATGGQNCMPKHTPSLFSVEKGVAGSRPAWKLGVAGCTCQPVLLSTALGASRNRQAKMSNSRDVRREMVLDFGTEVVGPAAKIDEALRLSQADLDAAFLDVNVGGSSTVLVNRPCHTEASVGRPLPLVMAHALAAASAYSRLKAGCVATVRTRYHVGTWAAS